MKKYLLFLVTILLVACVPIQAPASTEQSMAEELVDLNVCYSSASTGQSAAAYALEKGIYAKYGLDVNLVYVEVHRLRSMPQRHLVTQLVNHRPELLDLRPTFAVDLLHVPFLLRFDLLLSWNLLGLIAF